MHAVLVGDDGKLHWSVVPDPEPKEDEVLLEIHATALNRADLLQRAGQYPPPAGWPEWFGLEAAGVIQAVGPRVEEEGKWHVGDQVCALLGGGGYAEYVAVPSGMLMPIPRGLSMIEAAALPEVFGAACLFLFYDGNLQKGETLLMQAGASGLASAVIPVAKAYGARVITTVISDDQAKAIAYLKADIVVNSTRQKLADVFKAELEAGHGVDIAIDCLGDAPVGECLPYMNVGGRWIMIATLAGDYTNVDLRSMYVRRTRLIGTTLRSRTPEQKSDILARMVREIWPMLENGSIHPAIFKVLPIQQAEEAHAIMASGKHVGKIVLTTKSTGI
ncbi:MAG: NAD(P)H-quinone oxidoreductase [Chloroflexi bacterium]|nr:NAD(P)H-quinone oxidoreductase [Chloroflexota bacterium]